MLFARLKVQNLALIDTLAGSLETCTGAVVQALAPRNLASSILASIVCQVKEFIQE